jgi:biopolymer transport protein ExbD
MPRVYVHSKATSWKDLNGELRSQLKLRPEWAVYVEADPNVAWANVVSAIDVAKGLHAQVVLLPSRQSHSSVGH